jgi:glycosyltransferase involved in cell wall biosynthesis
MNLYLIKSGTKALVNKPEDLIVSFADFKNQIFKLNIFKFLFKFKNSYLITYNKDYESNLVFVLLLLRVFTRNSVYIIDCKTNTLKVTYAMLLDLVFHYLTDLFYKYFIVIKIKKQVKKLIALVNQETIKINFSKTPIYLRTDLWFGVKSGGSVGHIAGVLNNLKNHFEKKPVLFSTDFIPTVSDHVLFKSLIPTNSFWNFSEIPTLASNLSFIKQFDNIDPNNFTFIYHRYSINNFLGVYLSLKYKLPLVLEFNGSEVWISKNWGKPLKYEKISSSIEFLNLLRAKLIVVVSNPIKNDLVKLGINSDKILVNPNGVDPDIYTPTLDCSQLKERLCIENKVILGFIGTFGPWHGAEVLAEAFCLLIEQNPELKNSIHLLMIGDGVKLSEVKGIINKFNLESNVTFTGIIPQTDGPLYLSSCDILVSPHVPNIDGTPFFGSPTKLFEYMSMAKGIVASDLDQIGEILKHNETAILVEPGNVHELAQGMKRLILDSNMRKQIGDNARKEIVDSYSWRIHTKKIFDRLSELD